MSGAKECGKPLKAGNGCPVRVAQWAGVSSHAPKGRGESQLKKKKRHLQPLIQTEA